MAFFSAFNRSACYLAHACWHLHSSAKRLQTIVAATAAFSLQCLQYAVGSLVFLIASSSINLFIPDMLRALALGPESLATSLVQTALDGSACWVELNGAYCEFARRINQPSARS